MHDLVIRNGKVVDGCGEEAFGDLSPTHRAGDRSLRKSGHLSSHLWLSRSRRSVRLHSATARHPITIGLTVHQDLD